MNFFVVIASIYVAIKTIAYGIFEYKKNSNKIVGIFICILGIFCLIAPNII